jgi:hypothetical protein
MTMKRIILLASLWLLGVAPALAQTTPFSTYVLGLAAVGSLTGAERMVAISGGVPKTLTPNQILSFVSGDCALVSPPSIVCTKTNGVNFVASATTDTTNAANISSGTLSLTRMTLASASIYVGNGSNNPAAVVMSGDCTITNAGVITCPKANGVTFAASATTDTTNATNISSGTLASARQSAANLAASGNGGVTGVLPYANHPTGSLDQVVGFFGSTTMNAIGVPNCTSGSLQYSTTTHGWSCASSAGSGNVSTSGSITTNQIAQWASATTIKSTPLSSLATINVVKVQTFTSSGTYTPSTGLQYVIIECVGGGAGGGGAGFNGAGGIVTSSGGGSGGYSKALASAATIGGSQVVTIGNAGAGNIATFDGANGGNTSLGSLCVANGGSGVGTGANTGGGGAGGAGGTAGTGNIMAIPGSPGGVGFFASSGVVVFVPTGAGGSSFYGTGGGALLVFTGTSSGNIANGYGGGGGGASNGGTGGNGTPGYIVITEFTNQ